MPNSIKNTENITIRPATQADLPAIVAIYNQSVLTKQATSDLTPISVADRQVWFESHGFEKNRPILVATDNENLLGWGTLSNLYERPAYRIASEISLYIDDKAHGKGIGTALVTRLLELAPSCEIQQVVVRIFAHNQPSLNLFKKLGFEEWGYLKQVCDMDGFIADVMILGKAI